MTNIFYLDNCLNNGECHLDWISIDTAWQLLEEYLGEPRSYSKKDQHLRIGRRWFFSTSQSEADFVAMLFKVCPKSTLRCNDWAYGNLTLKGGPPQIWNA